LNFTILGGGGAVGTELARELGKESHHLTIVNRNPKKVNKSDELISADILDSVKLDETVRDSGMVFVTVGFEYKTQVWKEKWPLFMSNLINSCRNHQVRIVFVDNMYMYDSKYQSDMTESTPVNPSSEKGKIRAKIARMLIDALEKGDVKALIARAADFYGPGVTGSYLTQMVLNNLKKGKSPQWVGKLDVIHNFTFTPDIGKALVLLAKKDDSFNQIWHLPTYQGKLTSRDWIKLMMKEMSLEKKISSLPMSLMGLLGIFVPILREIKDIGYQLERDYFFNSSKFHNAFSYLPVTPEEGINDMVRLSL